MKSAVKGLELQREIVFVANHAGIFLAILGSDHHATSRPRVRGFNDGITNLLDRAGDPIGSQIGGYKPARAGDDVTLGAACFAVKHRASAGGIARQGKLRGAALPGSHVGDDSLKGRAAPGGGRRHTRSGDAFLHDAEDLIVRTILSFRVGGDVRRALAAMTVQTMATSAMGSERLLPIDSGLGM